MSSAASGIPAIGRAAASATDEFKPFKFIRRSAGEKDIVIDIKYCGICHSDIHTARSEWPGTIYPVVPGHEIAGVVREVGAGVRKYKVGDRVGVGCLVDSCRRCDGCTSGLEQYCTGGFTGTYNSKDKKAPPQEGKEGAVIPTYGGYSNVIVVDEDYVLRIPDSLSLDAAAPLLCAGITTYSPLRHWKAGPGKKVGVIGLGGLGHMAVKLAAAMGCEVTVFSRTDAKKVDATRLGATSFVATGALTADGKSPLEEHAGKFHLIINTVSGGELDVNQYFNLLKADGALVAVGVPEKPVPVNALPLVFGRRSYAGSLIGGIAETQEMLDFCAEHGLACDIEVISPDEINEAYTRVLKSDVRYRFVIDMAKLSDH